MPVSANFDTKNKELTIKGFVDLHQMEAEDSGGDTDDMWVSLLAMGFNHTLLMEQVRDNALIKQKILKNFHSSVVNGPFLFLNLSERL